MRITLVSPGPPYRGGISDLSTLIYTELVKNHTVQFINFKRQYPGLLFPGKTEYKQGEVSVELETERILDSMNPLSWLKAVKQIREFEPDVVLFRYWHPFFAPLISSMSRRLKRAGISAGLLVDNLLPHEPTVLDKALARMVVNPADWIFTMSQAVSADAREHTGINPRRTLFHPLYGLFADQIPSAEARQALSLDERPVLLFFGLIRPYKGLDDYLRALADLKKRQVEFQGLVVGESYEDPGKYHKLINDLALSDDVRFVDQFVPDNEVPVYFSAADVLVLPYRSATQSGIVGIAFQQDRPVIATRVGGLDEYVTEGVTGYLVPPEDPAALAERLEFFIRHNEAQPMSENVARMKSRFGINRFCRELLEALDE